jgi:hypothetical protein
MQRIQSLKVNQIALISAIAAIFLFMAVVITGFVPINMDESVQFHVISCDYYNYSTYNIFAEPCDGSLDLDFFGIKIKRAFKYIGSLSSYLYYPFFLLSPHILTQQILGIVSFVLFIIGILWLEQERKLTVIILFGLNYPIVYQLIHDTGPIRFGLLVTVFSPVLARTILKVSNEQLKLLLKITFGILLFLAVEDKPFFLYLLPSLTLLVAAYSQTGLEKHPILMSKYLLKEFGITIAIFCLMTLAYLFLSRTSQNRTYFSSIRNMNETKETFRFMFAIFSNFQLFSHRVFFGNINTIIEGIQFHQFAQLNIPLTLSFWASGCLLLVKSYQRKIGALPIYKTTYTLGAFLVSIVIFLVSRNTWAGHHFIYPYIFILLAICQSITIVKSNGKLFFLIFSACLSVILTIQLFFLVPDSHSSWERYKVFDYLKQASIAENHLITHMTWGAYNPSSVYGHAKQAVLYTGNNISTVNKEMALKIIKISEESNRKILCVCNEDDCNAEKLASVFLGKIQFKEAILGTKEWKVYIDKAS